MPRLKTLALASALVMCVAASTFAQTAGEWAGQAHTLYNEGHFTESADAYAKAIEAGAMNPAIFYNAACSAALANQADTAFEFLSEAIAHGWRDVTLLEEDSDLDSLHDDDRWPETLVKCQEALADYLASITEPALRDELLEMRRIDQLVRRGQPVPEWPGANMMEVDAKNTSRMMEIIAMHGWPTRSLVGDDGARSAWLLVQHADANPVFQRECLDLMLACEPGQVSAVDVAYLTDRILVNDGKPQVYGTQFWSVDGTMEPRPIADPSAVEALRAKIGMQSMQDYHTQMTGRPWVPDEAPE